MKEKKKNKRRFRELMKRTKKINRYFHFTNKEIEFLGKYNLAKFQNKFPAGAEEYMSW